MLVVFVCVEWCPTHIVFCFSFVFLRRVTSFSVKLFNCPKLVSHRRDSSFECFIDLRVDVIYMFSPPFYVSVGC
jgi:hypothetical protein